MPGGRVTPDRGFPPQAVSAKYSAELGRTLTATHVPEALAQATGKPVRRESQTPAGTFSVCNAPKIDLFPPRKAAAALVGQELVQRKAVPELAGASKVPARIFAQNFFRMRLTNGKYPGMVFSSAEAGYRHRDRLVRVRSHMRQAMRRGRGLDVAVGGLRGWKGRGPSAVDSPPLGAPPEYPDPGQEGNDLSESQGDRILSGAGFFPRGFPNPPTTCLHFSLSRDLSV